MPAETARRGPANVEDVSLSQPQQLSLIDAAETPQPAPPPAAAPVWLQRMSLVVLVLFCFYIGVVMAFIPWSPRYWDHNAWLLGHPVVEAVVQSGWVRGLVSGIGLIDIWIGVSELLHYRDYRG